MAVGDCVTGFSASVAGASYLELRPTGSVQVMITHAGSSQTSNGQPVLSVNMTEGTNPSVVWVNGTATSSQPLKLFVNNTYWLRVYNTDGSARNLCYSGIQTHA